MKKIILIIMIIFTIMGCGEKTIEEDAKYLINYSTKAEKIDDTLNIYVDFKWMTSDSLEQLIETNLVILEDNLIKFVNAKEKKLSGINYIKIIYLTKLTTRNNEEVTFLKFKLPVKAVKNYFKYGKAPQDMYDSLSEIDSYDEDLKARFALMIFEAKMGKE